MYKHFGSSSRKNICSKYQTVVNRFCQVQEYIIAGIFTHVQGCCERGGNGFGVHLSGHVHYLSLVSKHNCLKHNYILALLGNITRRWILVKQVLCKQYLTNVTIMRSFGKQSAHICRTGRLRQTIQRYKRRYIF